MSKSVYLLIFNLKINTLLINSLSIYHLPFHLKTLFYRFFLKKYWLFLKKRLVYKNDRVLTLNSTKSLYYNFYFSINQSLRYPEYQPKETDYSLVVRGNFLPYQLKPFQILEFPFHKKTYNTFVFFIIYLITHNFISHKNDFTLKYSFIIKPDSFNTLSFLNKFYFQTINY